MPRGFPPPYPWRVAAEAVLESHGLEIYELVFVDLLATVAAKSGGSTLAEVAREQATPLHCGTAGGKRKQQRCVAA
jgi:hypothetical protein